MNQIRRLVVAFTLAATTALAQGPQINIPIPQQPQTVILLRPALLGPNRVTGRKVQVIPLGNGSILLEESRPLRKWLDPFGLFK